MTFIQFKKHPLIITGLVAILGISIAAFGWWYLHNNSLDLGSMGPSNEITTQQIAEHSTASDCWGGIGGAVYMLTDYFAKHTDIDPSNYCGLPEPKTDADKNMTAENLASYHIGILAP